MLARHSFPVCRSSPHNSLRIRTYERLLRQPLYHHHLQTPPKSVHSKAPTSPAESTLTQFPAANPFILRTCKEHGEGVSLLRSVASLHHLSPTSRPLLARMPTSSDNVSCHFTNTEDSLSCSIPGTMSLPAKSFPAIFRQSSKSRSAPTLSTSWTSLRVCSKSTASSIPRSTIPRTTVSSRRPTPKTTILSTFWSFARNPSSRSRSL